MKIIHSVIPLSESFPFNAFYGTIHPAGNAQLTYHWHECFEITFVKSGAGVYYVNGHTHPMLPGDIILFNNMEPHAWHATSDEPMVQPVIVFDPSLIWAGRENTLDSEYLKPFYGSCTNYENKLPSGHPITCQIFAILIRILEEFDEKPKAYELMIKAKLLEIMTYLIRYFQTEDKQIESVGNRKQKLLRLEKVLEYTNANYTLPLRIDEAAALAQMSPAYFSTFFKKNMGISFTDYVNKCRVVKVVELVESTDDTVTSIAFACGFNSMSNFYQAYKKFKGGSPSKSR